jgi:hypothetical protein
VAPASQWLRPPCRSRAATTARASCSGSGLRIAHLLSRLRGRPGGGPGCLFRPRRYTELMFSLQSLKGAATPLLPRLSTGIETLDASLGGGLPFGKIVEVSGLPGSGRSSLALSMGLRCLALGHAVAWVESRCFFWPLPAIEAGVPLNRLLVLRVPPAEQLHAAELLLSSPGAVRMAIIDFSRAPEVGHPGSSGLRAGVGSPEGRGKQRGAPHEMLPFQLARLHRLAERSSALLLFLTDRPPDSASLGSLVDIRLHLRLPRADSASRASIFDRRLEVAVLRHKQGPSQGRFSESLHGPDRLRLRSTL